MRRTKIVCTLGTATDNAAVLRRLAKAGMSVARINMSHSNYTDQAERIAKVKQVRGELKTPIAVMLDTKGPEVRVKTFAGGSAELSEGQAFAFMSGAIDLCSDAENRKNGDSTGVCVTYPDLHKYIKAGDVILADDGNIGFRVTRCSPRAIETIVTNGGVLKDRKSLNFPDVPIDMEYLSAADKEDIAFGAANGVDAIALSFVRNAQDIKAVKNYLAELGGGAEDTLIISKIENRQGVTNMDSIIAESDGIMVARGDMGVEIPFEELPVIQKKLIKKCNRAGKIVIIATQMLESMINNPRPTRAEISDVANAVYDGASATMLSGETAVGRYAVETVKTMAKIIDETERAIDYKKHFNRLSQEQKIGGLALVSNSAAASKGAATGGAALSADMANSVAHSAVATAHTLNAKAVVAISKRGTTIKKVSRFRPLVPIIGAITSPKLYYQLAFSWGVMPVLASEEPTSDQLIQSVAECAKSTGLVKKGDLIVIVAGIPVGVPGNINLMKIHIVE